MTEVSVKLRLENGAEMPVYKTAGSAGFDLKAQSFKKVFNGKKEIDLTETLAHCIANGYITLRPAERVMIGTGLFMEIPEGFQLEIRSRSGLALEKGLTVSNQPGTVDSDYRGEICIIITNTNSFLARLDIGDRVAQGVLMPVYKAVFSQEDTLQHTQRGSGGFGSTGFQ